MGIRDWLKKLTTSSDDPPAVPVDTTARCPRCGLQLEAKERWAFACPKCNYTMVTRRTFLIGSLSAMALAVAGKALCDCVFEPEHEFNCLDLEYTKTYGPVRTTNEVLREVYADGIAHDMNTRLLLPKARRHGLTDASSALFKFNLETGKWQR